MKKLFNFLVLVVALTLASCTNKKEAKQAVEVETNFTQFVDPYIGSDYHGHVFVGANVPFGAVQLGPNNPTQGWDWCSGYHYSDSILIGFAHTHLSGTGIGDLGDILFMPVSGDFVPSKNDKEQYSWQAKYTHQNETVKPGYYSIDIEKYNIKAELTTSERVGFHKYNFKNEGNSEGCRRFKIWNRLGQSHQRRNKTSRQQRNSGLSFFKRLGQRPTSFLSYRIFKRYKVL
ncbi:hypothetical protein MASR2M47_46990 [Draconibacterium sp.]